MRATLIALAAVFTLAAFGAAPSDAALPGGDTIMIVDNDLTTTRACSGKTVVKIMGNENKVTLTGECAAVDVIGNENQVTIEAAARISVPGNENTVVWERGVGGKAPKISTLGNDNKVSQKTAK